MAEIIRVLVVDDSAYVRKVVSQMLSRSPFIDIVGTARDGAEALEVAAEQHPDVITCDLNMPVMDGITFVREQMARRRVPIIIISVAAESAEQVLAALDAGAMDFVQKPTALATERLLDMSEELIEKVKAAARSIVRAPLHVPVPRRAATRPPSDRADVVVIGVSTGGPQGLKRVIPRLPADFPVPVLIVMHMPVGYTALYAEKLDELSPLHVIESAGNEPVEPGTVILARAGVHLSVVGDQGRITTHLDIRPLDTPHRPAVDVLFRSAAEVFGSRTLGVVMTGMGSDGREGAAWIKARGGCILTEAEESCVVYGMPRSVVEAGVSDASVPLEDLAEAIRERV
jgi:two-component system chemotaxis response regulator CheB